MRRVLDDHSLLQSLNSHLTIFYEVNSLLFVFQRFLFHSSLVLESILFSDTSMYFVLCHLFPVSRSMLANIHTISKVAGVFTRAYASTLPMSKVIGSTADAKVTKDFSNAYPIGM